VTPAVDDVLLVGANNQLRAESSGSTATDSFRERLAQYKTVASPSRTLSTCPAPVVDSVASPRGVAASDATILRAQSTPPGVSAAAALASSVKDKIAAKMASLRAKK
jgi:hypothetical protein